MTRHQAQPVAARRTGWSVLVNAGERGRRRVDDGSAAEAAASYGRHRNSHQVGDAKLSYRLQGPEIRPQLSTERRYRAAGREAAA